MLTYNDDGRVYEIALAPKVTSNHRHYVVYRTPSKEEIEELLGKLREMSFKPRRADGEEPSLEGVPAVDGWAGGSGVATREA